MIETKFQYGAMYLMFDETLLIEKMPIHSPQGFTININDKVHRIGKKRRTMFELNDGLFMKYEGVISLKNNRLAIFNVPQHNEVIYQANLFSKPLQYRYCFNLIEVKGKFIKFLSGSHQGCRDIVMDYLELIN